jgi:hypothetical protein
MDREAAVLRSEMSQTRADLDRKLTRLKARAEELTPRSYARRLVAERLLDRLLGVGLVTTGAMLARRAFKRRRRRGQQARDAARSHERYGRSGRL